MFQHLANCHAEWNFFFAIIGSLPFFGAWIKIKLLKKSENTGDG